MKYRYIVVITFKEMQEILDPRRKLMLAASVVNWQEIGRKTQQSPQGNQRAEKSAAEFFADFSKNGIKVAEHFKRMFLT
jgi:hypothetical protein